MGLSPPFGNVCLIIVSKFMITGLILFSLTNEKNYIKRVFFAGCRQKITKYHITKLNLQIKADFTTIHRAI